MTMRVVVVPKFHLPHSCGTPRETSDDTAKRRITNSSPFDKALADETVRHLSWGMPTRHLGDDNLGKADTRSIGRRECNREDILTRGPSM